MNHASYASTFTEASVEVICIGVKKLNVVTLLEVIYKHAVKIFKSPYKSYRLLLNIRAGQIQL